jgi:hypothetical protein
MITKNEYIPDQSSFTISKEQGLIEKKTSPWGVLGSN